MCAHSIKERLVLRAAVNPTKESLVLRAAVMQGETYGLLVEQPK